MLYPKENSKRNVKILDGLWHFSEDRENKGFAKKWFNKLPHYRDIAVPGSWNEQYHDLFEYMGVGWYEKDIFIHEINQSERLLIRIGSGSNKCTVFINGVKAAFHEGGHLPFEADITDLIHPNTKNHICIAADQTLDPWSLPPASLEDNEGHAGFLNSYPAVPYDFFPYGGIERSILLYKVPSTRITDITIKTKIDGTISYKISLSDNFTGTIKTNIDEYNKTITVDNCCSIEGKIKINNPQLWCCENPFLYEFNARLEFKNELIDEYSETFGIREIRIEGEKLLLNGKEIYLRGFGKHEDFYVSGKGHNRAVNVKDFGLLKWIGANSFRTSHYPYDEEILDMADRQGFLIIDETPFVSLDNRMYKDDILIKAKRVISELIARDKNHPSVIMWSLANEPYVDTDIGVHFFKEMADHTRFLDNTRPITYVSYLEPSENKAIPYFDVMCLNKYYGWYTGCGQIEEMLPEFEACLDNFYDTFKKPLIVTEFGADAIQGMHSLPAQMFTEDYQTDLLKRHIELIESKPYCIGYHIWTFADFKTAQTVTRVLVNHKGVFTREREPKASAYMLKHMLQKKIT